MNIPIRGGVDFLLIFVMLGKKRPNAVPGNAACDSPFWSCPPLRTEELWSKCYCPLKMKLAAAIGPGTQPFPWISINDLCRAMAFIIESGTLRGTFNFVSPQEITQYAFARALAKPIMPGGRSLYLVCVCN